MHPAAGGARSPHRGREERTDRGRAAEFDARVGSEGGPLPGLSGPYKRPVALDAVTVAATRGQLERASASRRARDLICVAPRTTIPNLGSTGIHTSLPQAAPTSSTGVRGEVNPAEFRGSVESLVRGNGVTRTRYPVPLTSVAAGRDWRTTARGGASRGSRGDAVDAERARLLTEEARARVVPQNEDSLRHSLRVLRRVAESDRGVYAATGYFRTQSLAQRRRRRGGAPSTADFSQRASVRRLQRRSERLWSMLGGAADVGVVGMSAAEAAEWRRWEAAEGSAQHAAEARRSPAREPTPGQASGRAQGARGGDASAWRGGKPPPPPPRKSSGGGDGATGRPRGSAGTARSGRSAGVSGREGDSEYSAEDFETE